MRHEFKDWYIDSGVRLLWDLLPRTAIHSNIVSHLAIRAITMTCLRALLLMAPRSQSTGATNNAYGANRRLDVDETVEDRLLLAGLRRLSGGNRAPGGGGDTDRLRKGG